MKENNSEVGSCKRRCVSIRKAVVAGIIATLLLEVLLYIQGQNSPLGIGTIILGAEVSPVFIYLIGGVFCLLIGVIYAVLYALLLAPIDCIHDLLQGIIIAVVMTIIAVFMFPKLQTIFDTVEGRHSQVQELAQKPVIADRTEVVKHEGVMRELVSEKQMIVLSFMNHLIYALALIIIYRCYRRSASDLWCVNPN